MASIPLVWAPSPMAGAVASLGAVARRRHEPARPAQLVGRDALTVPVRATVQLDAPQPVEAPDPAPRLDIPAMPVESGLRGARRRGRGGAADRVAVTRARCRTWSGWRTRGGLSAAARAIGLAPTDGPGGDGDGLTPGNGVSWPRLVREVKPNYTPDAMRAQVEGMVELEILVLEDGSVGRVNIVRSLDARFGLDQEAINAVRRWRFDPGRRMGKAVATRVGVELSFNLR